MSERKGLAGETEHVLAEAGLRALPAPPSIQVWRSALVLPEQAMMACFLTLSPEDRIRADSHGNAELRDRFVARHGILRFLLAERLACEPRQVPLSFNRGEKPALSQGTLNFNISFSGDTALFAISTSYEVGVDIEAIQPDFPTDTITGDHFSDAERSLLARVPSGPRVFAMARSEGARARSRPTLLTNDPPGKGAGSSPLREGPVSEANSGCVSTEASVRSRTAHLAPDGQSEDEPKSRGTRQPVAPIPSTTHPDRAALFFAMWTRKEACAKALGIGITDSFACYEVPYPISESRPELAVFRYRTLDPRLTVVDLDAGEGYAAALAWQRP